MSIPLHPWFEEAMLTQDVQTRRFGENHISPKSNSRNSLGRFKMHSYRFVFKLKKSGKDEEMDSAAYIDFPSDFVPFIPQVGDQIHYRASDNSEHKGVVKARDCWYELSDAVVQRTIVRFILSKEGFRPV